MSYVHLHCHSHFSLLDGANRLDAMVKRAKEMGMPALALTDHGNLFGAIQFYNTCKEHGIKPILGYEAYIAPGCRTERDGRGISEAAYHLTLLAKNATGWKNLLQLASSAYLEGFYYRPRIDKEILEQHSSGLICLSGCASSEFAQHLIEGRLAEATYTADWFRALFGDDFYIEVMDNGNSLQNQYRQYAIEVAGELEVPVVATSDTHYLCESDARMHEILVAVNTGKRLSDTNRMRGDGSYHLASPTEMLKKFDPAFIKNTLEIAEKVNLELDLKTKHYPPYKIPGQENVPSNLQNFRGYLREKCIAGLQWRYPVVEDDFDSGPTKEHWMRLEHELDIINRLGFNTYFLVVADFVEYARNRGIPVSARGSACGSLVTYALGLSTVDPMVHGLLFERFLDPSRTDPPDIDIDFCRDRRDEVVSYVKEKYGPECVANIITFGTMGARAAIRDVGRVLNIPLPTVNRLVDLVPDELYITLPKALAKVPELVAAQKDPATKELMEMAIKLEGTNRHTGVHAAGLVIADKPLAEYVPLAKAKDGTVTTQWGMGDLEKIGLLKMDFLGLRNLTILSKCKQIIQDRDFKGFSRPGRIDLDRLPLDDEDVWKMIREGDTAGVFQLDTDSARRVIADMQPTEFNDIIAIAALNRPATLSNGMVEEYVNVKNGRKLREDYPHPIMAQYLDYTYGVMVYQEQVMQILHSVGKMELARAYACIKAISKKKPLEIAKFKDEFINGAIVSPDYAEAIWAKIKAFGGYGFNKSHSTAYAMIAYQTAYLKAHYPLEFMAALMSTELSDPDRLAEHIADCRRRGMKVNSPSINDGKIEFSVEDNAITCSLAVVRGISERAVRAIAAEADNREFAGVWDFCHRIEKSVVNKAGLEQLIKAGAFDFTGIFRAAMVAAIPGAIKAADKAKKAKAKKKNQATFVWTADMMGPAECYDREIAEWTPTEKFAHEKHALGFYLSGNPLDAVGAALEVYRSHDLKDLPELRNGTQVVIGGMFGDVKVCSTKNASRGGNYRMARFTIEDKSGRAQCVMFPDDYMPQKAMIADGFIALVIAKVDHTYQKNSLIVERIVPTDKSHEFFIRGVTQKIKYSEGFDVDQLAQVYDQTKFTYPNCSVKVQLEADDGNVYIFNKSRA